MTAASFPNWVLKSITSSSQTYWNIFTYDLWKKSYDVYSAVLVGHAQWLSGKLSTSQCRRWGFIPWFWKISWRRKWQPTPVFLPGEFPRQRGPAGYSPWSLKESDMTSLRSSAAQSCPTLCDPMDCSLPGSSAHGISQARVLEWGAIAFSDSYR